MRWSFLFALVTLVVHARHPLAPVSRDVLATNLLVADPNSGSAAYRSVYEGAHIGLIRWPGGGDADLYQWRDNRFSACPGRRLAAPSPSVAFDRWMRTAIAPLHLDVAVTVNYGSDASCTRGGDADEAAAWVRDARAHGDAVRYWTVGNEPYFRSEIDRNDPAHDPGEYARRVAREFYPRMKAADPRAQVGIAMALGSLTGDSANDAWDRLVLARARYDFVELHFYPSYGNTSDDRELLGDHVAWLRRIFTQARALLVAAGHPGTPILLGEFDRDSGSIPGDVPGHETTSVVDALFTDEVIGEAIDAGSPVAASWLGIDRVYPDPQPSPRAFGLQRYGSWGLARSGSPQMRFPKFYAYQVAAPLVVPGARAFAVDVRDPALHAYAAGRVGELAVMVVNADQHAPRTIALAAPFKRGCAARTIAYGLDQYRRGGGAVTRAWSRCPTTFVIPAWTAETIVVTGR